MFVYSSKSMIYDLFSLFSISKTNHKGKLIVQRKKKGFLTERRKVAVSLDPSASSVKKNVHLPMC